MELRYRILLNDEMKSEGKGTKDSGLISCAVALAAAHNDPSNVGNKLTVRILADGGKVVVQDEGVIPAQE